MALSILRDVPAISADIELSYRRYLVKVIMILALPILGGFAVYDIFIQRYFPASILLVMFATILMLNYLVKKPIRKSKEDLYYQYFFTFFFAVFGLYLAYSIGYEAKLSRIPWAYLFPVVVFFALGEKKALLWVVILITVMAFLGVHFSSKAHIVVQELKLRFYISFSFIVVFSYLFERLRRSYQRELIENQQTLKESEDRYRKAYEDLKHEMKERRRAETAIRQGEQRFREMAENIREVFWLFDWNKQKVLYCSPAYEEIWGRSIEDLYQKYEEWADSIHPDDVAYAQKTFEKILETGGGEPREYRIVRPDGIIRWVSDRGFAIKDENGKVTRITGIAEDITERKQAELALRESKEKYKTLFNNAQVGIFRSTIDEGKLLETNLRNAQIGGWDNVDEFVEQWMGVDRYVEPDSRKRLLDVLYEKGEVKNFETRFLRKDNTVFWARMSANIDTDQGYIEGIIQDVTEEKEALETLRQSEARLKEAYDIINKSPAAVFLWKNEEGWPVELVTDNVAELFGYTAEELISGAVPYSETVHPDDLDRVAGEVTGYSAEAGRERFSHIPYRIVCKNGEVKWVDDRTYIRRDENDNITHYQGIVLDVTSSIEAQQALKESEEKFRNLAERSPNMIFINQQGAVVYANKRCEEVLGLEREQFYAPDFDFWSLIAPESIETIKQVLKKHMAGEDVEPYEYTIVGRDGTKIEVINTTKLIDYQGKTAILGIVTDITERKQMEREREDLIAELEAKNAELERFTYTVSHDLKSPLITIRGFLGLLETDLARGDTEKLKKDIKRISNATDQMRTMMDELLELSRIGRLVNPVESIATVQLVHEALESLAGIIHGKGITVDIHPNLPAVSGDRIRLLEVYQNIIENAVKFMGDRPAPRIEIGARQAEGNTVFYIKDNGLGIDGRYHEKIFGLFDKLDAEAEGSGVGLALAKRIIELHGGRIWVESEGPGRGATFCFTIKTKT